CGQRAEGHLCGLCRRGAAARGADALLLRLRHRLLYRRRRDGLDFPGPAPGHRAAGLLDVLPLPAVLWALCPPEERDGRGDGGALGGGAAALGGAAVDGFAPPARRRRGVCGPPRTVFGVLPALWA